MSWSRISCRISEPYFLSPIVPGNLVSERHENQKREYSRAWRWLLSTSFWLSACNGWCISGRSPLLKLFCNSLTILFNTLWGVGAWTDAVCPVSLPHYFCKCWEDFMKKFLWRKCSSYVFLIFPHRLLIIWKKNLLSISHHPFSHCSHDIDGPSQVINTCSWFNFMFVFCLKQIYHCQQWAIPGGYSFCYSFCFYNSLLLLRRKNF